MSICLEHPPIVFPHVPTNDLRRHSGMVRKHQTRNLEIPGSMLTHRPGMTTHYLPHHTRRKPGLPSRRLDVLLQEAMRFLAGIAGARVSPGAAFVVGGAGGLAGVVAVAGLEVEILVVAAEAVDRGLDGLGAPLDHAGAAHA